MPLLLVVWISNQNIDTNELGVHVWSHVLVLEQGDHMAGDAQGQETFQLFAKIMLTCLLATDADAREGQS